MIIETVKQLPKFLIETIKGVRKLAINQEGQFLHQLNSRITQNSYDFSTFFKKHKIIVSFTTHRDRIDYVHFVLDSLYAQTLRPCEVRLYVTRGEYEFLPPVLEKFKPWLKIVETEEIGSYKKFIPALSEAREDELIISLDDDFIYPCHLIASLYRLFLQNPQSLIGYCGFKNGGSDFDGIAGGMGILWNPKIISPKTMPSFFKKELFWDPFLRSADDAWIILSMKYKGIRIICYGDDYSFQRKQYIALPNEHIDPVSASTKGKQYISPNEKKSLKEKMQKIIREHF